MSAVGLLTVMVKGLREKRREAKGQVWNRRGKHGIGSRGEKIPAGVGKPRGT